VDVVGVEIVLTSVSEVVVLHADLLELFPGPAQLLVDVAGGDEGQLVYQTSFQSSLTRFSFVFSKVVSLIAFSSDILRSPFQCRVLHQAGGGGGFPLNGPGRLDRGSLRPAAEM